MLYMHLYMLNPIISKTSHKMSTSRTILRSLCIFLVTSIACSVPPEDPIKCSSNLRTCTITNAYNLFSDRSICRASQVVYPTTEHEIIVAVAKASKENLKVKVVTKTSHSIPKWVCPDGQQGMLISTRQLNRIVQINKRAMTMTVESGMTLKDLIEHAAKAGLALPHSPNWWGLTIGGIISNGAHGSSLWGKGSAVHEYVVGLRIISPAGAKEGYAKVWSLYASSSDMDAAKVSLGVLGVISQVTLQLQPLFKRSITIVDKEDSDLEDQITHFGNQHEFADMTWYPSLRKVIYKIDDRISSNDSAHGVIDMFAFRPMSKVALESSRSTEVDQESNNNITGKCVNAKQRISTALSNGLGYTNDGTTFKGYPIIGYQNKLQASGSCFTSPSSALNNYCVWDPRINGTLIYETSISIALSNAKKFIEDLKKLRQLKPEAFCNLDLYGGIVARYIKASSAFLGKQEDSIDINMLYYRSRDPLKPRLYEDILEEVEQMAAFKYGGLPHWGKNRNVAFIDVIKKFGKAKNFLKVKEKYDPRGLFSNEWTDQILGLKGSVTITKEGCALEGLCICSEDIHCAPSKGYVCRPGKVYKDARVCTQLGPKNAIQVL